jgi:hypothetical protein
MKMWNQFIGKNVMELLECGMSLNQPRLKSIMNELLLCVEMEFTSKQIAQLKVNSLVDEKTVMLELKDLEEAGGKALFHLECQDIEGELMAFVERV